MTDIHSHFELATLPEDLARYRFVSAEENLACTFYKPGMQLIQQVRSILSEVDWENFDPESSAAHKAFPILVAAANATSYGRDVLQNGLALSADEVSAYSKAGAIPETSEKLHRIVQAVKSSALQMIDSLEASFQKVGHYDAILN